MLLDACADTLGAGAHHVLSLLRGDEPYKHHWRPDTVVNQRLLLARRRTAPLLSAVVCDVGRPPPGQGTRCAGCGTAEGPNGPAVEGNRGAEGTRWRRRS